MFRDLIPRLSDAYHVIAPDYPGFGHSAVPDRARFAYTFDHLAEITGQLLDQLGWTGSPRTRRCTRKSPLTRP
jgi:pimeloyl-ACP methyl ester carboxylesterase